MNVVHVVRLDGTLGRRIQLHAQDPTCFDGLACEYTEQEGSGRPDDKDQANNPRQHAECQIDLEDAIEKQEQGQLRQRKANCIKISSHNAGLENVNKDPTMDNRISQRLTAETDPEIAVVHRWGNIVEMAPSPIFEPLEKVQSPIDVECDQRHY